MLLVSSAIHGPFKLAREYQAEVVNGPREPHGHNRIRYALNACLCHLFDQGYTIEACSHEVMPSINHQH